MCYGGPFGDFLINVRIRSMKHKLILEVSPRIPRESDEKDIVSQKTTHEQFLNMMCLKHTCLLCITSDFCLQYKQKQGESKEEKLECIAINGRCVFTSKIHRT